MTKRGDWINFIVGTRGDDNLQGTAGRDLLLGDGNPWGWSHCWWRSGGGNDTLDGGAGSDILFAGRGNDVANYTLAENAGASDYYDGGKGFDTLQLTFTPAELQLTAVQQDLAAFEAFLLCRADPHGDDGRIFEFKSFNLDVRDFEALQIRVLGGNTAPVARDDSYSLDEDTVRQVAGPGVLGNDTDAEGSALNVVLVTGPAHGALALNADGSFSYTPAPEFSGADSFAYRANDGTLDSEVVSVSLTVAAANDAPVAQDDVMTEPAGGPGPLRVAVVGGGNGSYVAAAAQLEDSTAFDIDADAFAVTAFATEAQWATLLETYDVVVLGDSGSGRDYGETQLFPALRDFVDAGGGVVTTGWFAFALTRIPTAVRGDADYITPISAQTYQFTGKGATIDVLDAAHPITEGMSSYLVSALNHELAGGVDAGATILATGQGSGGTRAAIAYDEVGAGLTVYFGSPQMGEEATYAPDRAPGGAADQIFERAVAWAAGQRGGDAVTDEDTPLVIDDAFLLANDTDVENDLLALASVSPTSALGGAVSIGENGDIVYDPRAALQHLDAGQIVTDSFDYVVTDGNGGFDTASLSFTVAGRADADTLL